MSSGEDPREFFQGHAEDIEESIEIADRDFLQFAEKHLEEFENDKKWCFLFLQSDTNKVFVLFSLLHICFLVSSLLDGSVVVFFREVARWMMSFKLDILGWRKIQQNEEIGEKWK